MPRLNERQRRAAGRQAAELAELFMAEHLRFTAGEWAGKPFKLAPWQREHIIRPIFGTLDRDGVRYYREALIGLPRWSGKSQTAAAICLTLMFTEPTYEGEYYVVATTRRQAQIVFDKAKRMILADPMLRAICKVYRAVIEIPETGQIFRALPWDADTAQGFHPTCCVIDEYHVHRDATMREAMLSGMVGTRGGLLVTISTAGDERRGPLWDLLKTAPRDPRAYVYWRGAEDSEDGHDAKVWRRVNPTWVPLAALRKQHKTFAFPVFERYHLNRFPSRGTNRAYPADLWDACADAPTFDEEAPTVLALDASWTRDTTALVAAQRSSSGVVSTAAWIWEKDGALGHIDHEAVETRIVELARDFNVTRIGCDPNYFTRSMLRLEHEFGLPIEEFPQENKRMSAASMTLYDVLQEGRLRHGGAGGIREHVLSAGVKATPHGWRLTKIEDDRKIDAAVALAIAVYLVEAEAGAFSPSFASTGGIYTLKLN